MLAILKFILILRMGFNSKPKWTLTWKTDFDFALKIDSESENSKKLKNLKIFMSDWEHVFKAALEFKIEC